MDSKSIPVIALLIIVVLLFLFFKVRQEQFIFGRVKKFFTDRISALEGPRTGMPPVLRTFLNQFGNSRVTYIKVCRRPVQGILQKVLNSISMGQVEQNKNRLGINELFHLYLIVSYKDTTGITKEIRLEKGATVEVNTVYPEDYGDCYAKHIEVPYSLTFNDLIYRAEALHNLKGRGTSFWTYTPECQNCQDFCMTVLQANGMLDLDLLNYMWQDAEAILEDRFNITKKFARKVTDLGGIVDVILYGL